MIHMLQDVAYACASALASGAALTQTHEAWRVFLRVTHLLALKHATEAVGELERRGEGGVQEVSFFLLLLFFKSDNNSRRRGQTSSNR